MFWNDKGKAEAGIKWTSKIVLQTAVVLLGFGMNLGVIFETGKQSLPIILCTITTSLVLAWIMKKVLKVPTNTSILVGVGQGISTVAFDEILPESEAAAVSPLRVVHDLAAPRLDHTDEDIRIFSAPDSL